MKKLLLMVCLVLCLAMLMAACTPEETPEETTTDAVTDAPTTEEPTEEPTEAPTDEPTTEAPTDEPTTEEPSTEETTPEPVEINITIDGDFSDWANTVPTVITADKFIAWTGAVPEGFVLSASFYADSENLYVYLNAGADAGITKYQICVVTNNDEPTDAAQAWYGITADGAACESGLSAGKDAVASMANGEAEVAIPIAALHEGYALPMGTNILLIAQVNGETNMATFHDGKNPNDDGWADRSGDGCPLTLNADGTYTIDLPVPPEVVPTYDTTVLSEETTYVFWEEGCGVTWNKTSFGHKFTVAEGYTVTSLATGELLTAAADYVIKVYEWKGTYADTVASEALFTREFNNGAENAAWTIDDVDVVLTGDLYWELTKADGSATVTYFVSEHAESKGLGATFIDGEYSSKDAKLTLTLEAVDTAPTTVLDAAESYVLWEEGCDVIWNKTSYGQKFTVADGYKVSSIATGELLTAAADYVIKVYSWKGTYAATVEAEPLLVREFNNGAENGAWTISDIDVELTGKLYWEVTKADGSATVTYFVSQHAESKGLSATFIDGVYSSNDAKGTITLEAIVTE